MPKTLPPAFVVRISNQNIILTFYRDEILQSFSGDKDVERELRRIGLIGGPGLIAVIKGSAIGTDTNFYSIANSTWGHSHPTHRGRFKPTKEAPFVGAPSYGDRGSYKQRRKIKRKEKQKQRKNQHGKQGQQDDAMLGDWKVNRKVLGATTLGKEVGGIDLNSENVKWQYVSGANRTQYFFSIDPSQTNFLIKTFTGFGYQIYIITPVEGLMEDHEFTQLHEGSHYLNINSNGTFAVQYTEKASQLPPG